MKASFEQVNMLPNESQLKQIILDPPRFEPFWHFHPEFELTYIISGSGKRIVGDSVEPFVAGDLVLLGPDLPHTWNSEENEFKKGSCRAIVFQFGRSLIPDPGMGFIEFGNIIKLLDLSQHGLFFRGNEVAALGKKLMRLSRTPGLQKLMGFWMILQELSGVSMCTILASGGYAPSLNKYTGERINKVFRYVSVHFAEEIKLSRVSQLVFMTETSFSRFFKQITGRTFTEYLNDTRISHAAVLLSSQQDKNISNIAAESGFTSSTHFNRIFLLKKGLTPTDFRRQFSA